MAGVDSSAAEGVPDLCGRRHVQVEDKEPPPAFLRGVKGFIIDDPPKNGMCHESLGGGLPINGRHF